MGRLMQHYGTCTLQCGRVHTHMSTGRVHTSTAEYGTGRVHMSTGRVHTSTAEYGTGRVHTSTAEYGTGRVHTSTAECSTASVCTHPQKPDLCKNKKMSGFRGVEPLGITGSSGPERSRPQG